MKLVTQIRGDPHLLPAFEAGILALMPDGDHRPTALREAYRSQVSGAAAWLERFGGLVGSVHLLLLRIAATDAAGLVTKPDSRAVAFPSIES